MPAFNIKYRHEGQMVFEETVFMKSLIYAKKSASCQAPQKAVEVVISDLMDRVLAERKQGEWGDLS
ncbi:hypothetical protein ETN89_20140 (plasmid) [Photobacterium damselae subsp. damselae]|uniref:hypothetical protein n=1 Tax=Photobacterium damselae TaxID=38293 RepID=UPI000A2FE5BB|nr:hypothetical protein [Photobacterium damselae]ARR51695.1 hypothetical protein CAY62_19875 [Photobacterium damselae subsp. damselae]QAY37564.1 hypothetical protein ETN89_20140 [Photobacterium damselae subsp. damselae]